MKQILYTSLYVPPEWIAAHGFCPVRVIPAGGNCQPNALDRQGVCPFMRNFASEVVAAPEAAGIIVTTICDQMRHGFDIIRGNSKASVFLMNVPTTWQSATARNLYVDELNRLGRFLEGLGGKRPSNRRLVEVMSSYDEARTSLRQMSERLSPRQFAQALTRVDQTGQFDAALEDKAAEAANGRVRIALAGGPQRAEDLAVFDMIEQHGGYVALDATDRGLRSVCRSLDRRRMNDEPLLELADAYFDSIQDVSRRPNDGFYEWLAPRLHSRRVDAIVVQRYLWCDLWHAEVERLRQRFGLPLLDLDLDGDEPFDTNRMRTRIGAFMEMLT